MATDKRQYERYAVEVEVVFERDGERVVARSRDISLGGMFITTDRALPYGTAVSLALTLPSLPSAANVDATVRWTGRDGMGVQFGSLRARETWAINQLIRR